MRPRRILLVTLQAPPSVASGARRPAGLVKDLARLGHEVIVLTSKLSGSGPVPGAVHTLRTRDLMTTEFNWRRGQAESFSAPGAVAQVAAPSRLEHYAIPDLQVLSWIPFAVPAALRLARTARPEAVVTTGPPHSAHLVGAALRARGLPWLADLQDGWTFDPHYDPGLAATTAFGRRLERAVLGRADARSAISAPIARDLAQRFGSGAHLSLAYDPDEMAAADAAVASNGQDPLLAPDRLTLLYTGSIIDVARTPETLWEALRRLKARRPDAGRLELVVVGPVRADLPDQVRALGVDDLVRFAPSVARVRALALQRAADALLVLAHEDRPSILTNKLVEYLVARRPIVVLGATSEAGRLVRQHDAGVVVSSVDPDAVAGALARLLDGDVAAAAPEGLEELSSPYVARRVAELLEDAVRR